MNNFSEWAEEVERVEIDGLIDFFLPWTIKLIIPYIDCLFRFIHSAIIKHQRDMVILHLQSMLGLKRLKEKILHLLYNGWKRDSL